MACVTNAGQLVRSLGRMLSSQDGFTFPNASGEFHLVLRPDTCEPDFERAFQLCIMLDNDDEDEDEDCPPLPKTKLQKALEAEYYGSFDDDVFVFGTYDLDDDEDMERALKDINRLHAAEVCKCGGRLIKDGANMCMFCQMTAVHDRPAEHTCPICMECSAEMHFRKQPCCGQMLHHACLGCCRSTLCPLCRSPTSSKRAP